MIKCLMTEVSGFGNHCQWFSQQLRGPWIFPGGSDGKVSAYNAGDLGSIPGSGRSPGEGNGNPLQYSCLENPMDGGTWLGYSPWYCRRVGRDWATEQQHQSLMRATKNKTYKIQSFLVVVQPSTCVQPSATPRTAAHQASLSLTISRSCPSLCPLHWWCHHTGVKPSWHHVFWQIWRSTVIKRQLGSCPEFVVWSGNQISI